MRRRRCHDGNGRLSTVDSYAGGDAVNSNDGRGLHQDLWSTEYRCGQWGGDWLHWRGPTLGGHFGPRLRVQALGRLARTTRDRSIPDGDLSRFGFRCEMETGVLVHKQ